ncbi:cation/H(+) antiporter 20-like [Arachis hypogaea]|uniref:cation/H(+) antiporter 20-like n=1 Tax=Arachis hypogaea TaxID=3818 RepID=UPI003B218497
MAAAAFNDVAAWILLVLTVALTGKAGGSGGHKSPLVSVDKAGGAAVLKGARYGGRGVYLLNPRLSDGIGIHDGLDRDPLDLRQICVRIDDSEGREFCREAIQRIEDFVSRLLLSLYFASSRLKIDEFRCRIFNLLGM